MMQKKISLITLLTLGLLLCAGQSLIGMEEVDEIMSEQSTDKFHENLMKIITDVEVERRPLSNEDVQTCKDLAEGRYPSHLCSSVPVTSRSIKEQEELKEQACELEEFLRGLLKKDKENKARAQKNSN